MNTTFYFASLEGELIECKLHSDAEAVNRADVLLREVAHGSPGELHALAVVLVRYGRQSAAERLTNRARAGLAPAAVAGDDVLGCLLKPVLRPASAERSRGRPTCFTRQRSRRQ
jgi:hypothetical protein